ncbi:protein-L-isoaspartate O-methyltransferase family protein [Rickettsiales endosymbiont of Stachyamoeba lipophora]|uniref:protein-L-isoaspartate O-methyltransferase family protein n=1 Tax=Rickettsiales endosymbiont of Stachyamoeba lipophora TaxID=2486578 RepID=UPI000F6491C9|nr:methyltransferase domain-containing protein [Rickettsiales endosymbiont of Stachyamoeba lipophora]AZL15711.1 hypothetical protein EF513_04005 [Rickettsiales endosymbiont of Stachyamoeba lipophora]
MIMISEIVQRNMVLNQLCTNKLISQKYIDAISKVPREKLLPELFMSVAYSDNHLQIAEQVYQASPLLFAKILLALDLKPSEKVLEIGSGAGINSIILAHIVAHIDSLSSNAHYIHKANRFLHKNNITNCHFITSVDLDNKYDVIIVNGYVECEVIEKLSRFLEPNGKMVVFNIMPNQKQVLDYLPLCEMNIVVKSYLNFSTQFIERINIFPVERVNI